MGKSARKSTVPADQDGDIAFARLARQVAVQVDACVGRLTRQFQALGLHWDVQSRPTPRGLSTFLSVIGERGLVCIVDITLIEGAAVSGCKGGALDLRLLDACGEVVAHCASATASQAPVYRTRAGEVLSAACVDRSATSVFVMAVGLFNLVQRPTGIQGGAGFLASES